MIWKNNRREVSAAVQQFKLDDDTKKIVKAIIHADAKRQKRKRAGRQTEFDRKAEEAIRAAKENMRLCGYDDNARQHMIGKIYESLLYNQPWEMLGETYCCRRLFYEYRKEFCYYVAEHLGIIEDAAAAGSKAVQKQATN